MSRQDRKNAKFTPPSGRHRLGNVLLAYCIILSSVLLVQSPVAVNAGDCLVPGLSIEYFGFADYSLPNSVRSPECELAIAWEVAAKPGFKGCSLKTRVTVQDRGDWRGEDATPGLGGEPRQIAVSEVQQSTLSPQVTRQSVRIRLALPWEERYQWNLELEVEALSMGFNDDWIWWRVSKEAHMRWEVRRSGAFSATLSIDGLPKTESMQITIDNATKTLLKGGNQLDVVLAPALTHVIEASPVISVKDNGRTRWYCANNSFSASDGQRVHFSYSKQYYAEVATDPPIIQSLPKGWYTEGHEVPLDAPSILDLGNRTRYVLNSWDVNRREQDGSLKAVKVFEPVSILLQYGRQYQLVVESDYGNVTGPGWYDEGDRTMIKMVEKEVPLPGWLGALGGRRVFAGWTIDGESAEDAQHSMTVNRPLEARAVWKDDPAPAYVTLTGLVVFAVLLAAPLAILVKRSLGARARPKIVQPGAPVCSSCGAKLPAQARYCDSCGKPIARPEGSLE